MINLGSLEGSGLLGILALLTVVGVVLFYVSTLADPDGFAPFATMAFGAFVILVILGIAGIGSGKLIAKFRGGGF